MQPNAESHPQTLQTNIIYLCGSFTHVFHQTLTLAFKANRIPVTIEQFSVLALLFYRDGINQKELGNLLNRDKTTITRIVSNMVRNQCIRIAPDSKDGRGKLVFLTPKGKSIQQKAVMVSGKLYMQALEGIPQNQLNVAMKVMTKMTENVLKC